MQKVLKLPPSSPHFNFPVAGYHAPQSIFHFASYNCNLFARGGGHRRRPSVRRDRAVLMRFALRRFHSNPEIRWWMQGEPTICITTFNFNLVYLARNAAQL